MAGDEYQPVWHHELKQPPFFHLRTGALTAASAPRVDRAVSSTRTLRRAGPMDPPVPWSGRTRHRSYDAAHLDRAASGLLEDRDSYRNLRDRLDDVANCPEGPEPTKAAIRTAPLQ